VGSNPTASAKQKGILLDAFLFGLMNQWDSKGVRRCRWQMQANAPGSEGQSRSARSAGGSEAEAQ